MALGLKNDCLTQPLFWDCLQDKGSFETINALQLDNIGRLLAAWPGSVSKCCAQAIAQDLSRQHAPRTRTKCHICELDFDLSFYLWEDRAGWVAQLLAGLGWRWCLSTHSLASLEDLRRQRRFLPPHPLLLFGWAHFPSNQVAVLRRVRWKIAKMCHPPAPFLPLCFLILWKFPETSVTITFTSDSSPIHQKRCKTSTKLLPAVCFYSSGVEGLLRGC